eukprot:jgi/Chlat1/6194/Chrsp427S05729
MAGAAAAAVAVCEGSVSSFNCHVAAGSSGVRTVQVRVGRPAAAVRRPLRAVAASLASPSAPSGLASNKGGSSKQLAFVKYQGLGNDFILVDNRHQKDPVITPDEAVRLCDRNFGVGADGVIFALPGASSDYTMRIYNADGSEPEMCGNGIRCMARFVSELEGRDAEQPVGYTIDTLAGPIAPQVVVDMGKPILKAELVPTKLKPNRQDGSAVAVPMTVDGKSWNVTCVSMGNPHCITFIDDVDALDLYTIGPMFERHEMFPARTNTEFVQVLSRTHLKMRVWERGAGPTLACGTGACALVVAAVLEGRAERRCRVDLPGGPLQIEWREEDGRIIMTGPAQEVFAGSWRLA